METNELRTRVLILTDLHRITGDIALAPGARLTDYLCEARVFLAVTNAEVTDLAGRRLCAAQFLDIHRDHIRLVAPLTAIRADRTDNPAETRAHA